MIPKYPFLCHPEEQNNEGSEDINVDAHRSFTSFRMTIKKVSLILLPYYLAGSKTL